MALLFALIATNCNRLSDFLSEDPEDILVLSTNPSSIPADGSSISNVRAKIPAGTPPDERLIQFSTSAGTFLDPNGIGSTTIHIHADSSGVAVAQLRSSVTVESAEVRAKSDVAGDRGRVHFVFATPVQIEVTTDRVLLSVSLSDTAAITATLRTNGGFATKGTPVQFTATEPSGAPVGGFANVTASNSSGQATAVFDPAGTAFRGTATVRARAQDPTTGAFIDGATTVEITN